ncbi:TPA: hypothetical protein U0919_000760 [Streptococcus suis]|uniref:hypothetical protein n=1 Tax=Streptococcus suis TaxID=1307 RepID=UPI0005176352|nr:hypothetical protein [Streptococcus suis]MBY4973561.1 hypothetical protein [Streptococcus suis]MBY5009349.1 hypothetical protein [Streptococcus suis]MDG4517815.1 hypothetical protein [Streptococcus suis]NQK94588.1 hypothetical protein [Streptococcus suis]HEM3177245.1 hypothetical protein [Streptococcus suis]
MSKISKNSLYFHLLTQDYFESYQYLDEFQEDCARGHGVMVLDIHNLLIAIPLRSGISERLRRSSHLFPYTTYKRHDGKMCLKALDFSKLTIIEEKHIDYTKIYHFNDSNEKIFYLRNSNRIFSRIKNYVNKYIDICLKIEHGESVTFRTLNPYRFSTLRNFHFELGIAISKQDFINQFRK